MNESRHSLITIDALPFDPDIPLLRPYPAMKLGVREAVRHYGSLLAPLAETIIAGDDKAEWVITGPPLYVLPAGANLMGWDVARRIGVRAVDLRYVLPYAPVSAHAYSRSTVADRVQNRRMLHEGEGAPRPEEKDFRDRAVIFLNDINVTGTQELFVRRTLETVHPRSIHWLYIVEVERELGRAHPEIEYQVNHASLATFEDFASVLASADLDYTSRCISRLFGYSFDELEPLLRSLDEERRKTLYRLIVDEGSYADEKYAAKRALLA